jgi:gliding motility associated protien GldN
MKKLVAVLVLGLGFSVDMHAQDTRNKPEVAEIYKMFFKTMWRRMDLEEKQNQPFFSKNAQLPKLLIEAMEKGLIKPYTSDSCLVQLTDEQVRYNLYYSGEQLVPQDPNDPFSPMVMKKINTRRDPTIWTAVYLREDVIFDRNRSRMYYYIRSVSLTIPAKPTYQNTYGVTGEGSFYLHFKYEEVIDLFRTPEYQKLAIWYNNQNIGAHRNMSDAFELRLFSAPIIKVSNFEDADLRQLEPDPWKVLLLQQKMEFDLVNYESELWEY